MGEPGEVWIHTIKVFGALLINLSLSINCIKQFFKEENMHTSNTNHPKQKNRLITMTLAMSLGIFGVDRFYLGKWKSGIAKGLTIGGFGIWWRALNHPESQVNPGRLHFLHSRQTVLPVSLGNPLHDQQAARFQ